jgi:hypothetical protein
MFFNNSVEGVDLRYSIVVLERKKATPTIILLKVETVLNLEYTSVLAGSNNSSLWVWQANE